MTEMETIAIEPPELTLQQVFILLEQEQFDPLQTLLNEFPPKQLALMLEAMPPAERKQLWELIPETLSAETLTFLHDEVRNSLIAEMPAEALAAAAEQMEVIDLAYIMEDLPAPVRQTLEESLPDDILEHLENTLSFEEGSAGRLMSTDVISVRSDVSLGVVKRYLHLHEDLPDYTDGLMVADRDGIYQGKLLLNRVLTGDDEDLVQDVMNSQHKPILATASEHDIALFFEQSHFVSTAVVDENNRLLGRISLDYVIAILKAEADHALLGRAGLDEEADLFAPVLNSARRRTVWLAINLVTAFLAAWVIGLYADTLEKIVALAVLMPIVASMGGIAGSQTLTLTIRGLALDQISSGNKAWLARKEVLIGIINGLLWALVVSGVAWLWFRDSGISLVIGAAIVVNLVAAAAAGIAIPLILQRLRIDPALSGAVILTTVTDVVGFMSFLGLATQFLV
ncbi:magnesium transporter [Methylomonas methanica]|uniref:Magnesium transporter MgtE n=1 Tax=Methylomonas methanica (strain DSM 25384 / MC09) TaxID=857087 RepID=F9ZZ22_METMM|nr:magnesium transporter [Methylomonas methanica]AEF99877.1 magnesium transporter [Methylomonas methanica MC09]